MFAALERGFEKYDIDLELQRYLRDVKDHVIRIVERGESFRQLLQNALQVHATLVGQRQNEEMKRLSETSLAQSEQTKKISSWAAIIFAPTLVGTIYGMNFIYMPELDWAWGYPFALVAHGRVRARRSTSSSSVATGCERADAATRRRFVVRPSRGIRSRLALAHDRDHRRSARPSAARGARRMAGDRRGARR